MHHETLGKKLLVDCGVPSPIPELVGNHIKAKRYNVYRNKHYEMSEASRKTFEFQGGPMNQSEALDFERDPLFEMSLQVRKYDELGKQKGLATKVRSNFFHSTLFPAIELLPRAFGEFCGKEIKSAQFMLLIS